MSYKKVVSHALIVMIIGIIVYFCLGMSYESKAALSFADLTVEMQDISLDPNITNSSFGNALRSVIAYIQIAGTGISIIVVTILGIKYITASVESKAEVKKSLMPVLIGMALLFAGVNIVGIAADIIGGMFG